MNPFYLSYNSEPIEPVGADVYVICQRDDYDSKIELFFARDTKIEELYALSSLISIVKMPINAVKRNGLINIAGSVMQGFKSTFLFSETVVVTICMMLESKYCDVKKWKELYDIDGPLLRYMRRRIFYAYHDLYNNQIENELLHLISNISSSTGSTNLNDRIIELMLSKTLSEKELLYLTCHLLLNKGYYFSVITNIDVLSRIHDIVGKYMTLFRYIWNYIYTFVWQDKHTYVIDIRVANNLPFSEGMIELSEFRRRLNARAGFDIFADMEWQKIYVTGEVISVNGVKTDKSINIRCHCLDTIEYIERVRHIHQIVSRNLVAYDSNIHPKDIKLVPKKGLQILINVKTLRSICEKQKILFTVACSPEIKYHLYKLYIAHKQAEDLSILGDRKDIPEFYEIVRLADINDTDVIIDNTCQTVKFVESLRYKIVSKFIGCPVRIFLTDNIVNTVANIATANQRSYYDGNNCYVLASSIMTLPFATDDPIYEAFDEDGNLLPVKKWIIDYAYDRTNSIKKN